MFTDQRSFALIERWTWGERRMYRMDWDNGRKAIECESRRERLKIERDATDTEIRDERNCGESRKGRIWTRVATTKETGRNSSIDSLVTRRRRDSRPYISGWIAIGFVLKGVRSWKHYPAPNRTSHRARTHRTHPSGRKAATHARSAAARALKSPPSVVLRWTAERTAAERPGHLSIRSRLSSGRRLSWERYAW